MDLDRFERISQDLEQRLVGLKDAARISPFPNREDLSEATAALGAALEQLRAARSSLRHQEEEIRIARMISEAERQRYRELFDEAPIGYLVTNPAGRIEEANRAARDLLESGLPGDPIGRSMVEAIAGPDRAAFLVELDRLARTGHLRDWEARLPGPDGADVRVAFLATAVPDWSPEPFALRWIIREVGTGPEGPGKEGARRVGPVEGHAPLAEPPGVEPDPAGLAEWVDGLDLIFWEAAPDGTIRYVNRRVLGLLGYPADRWVGRSDLWRDIVHGDDREWVEMHHRRCIGQGRDGELEFRLVAADGRVVWFRETIRVVAPRGGAVHAIRGTMWEIGRRKKIERQLNVARRELTEELAEINHLNGLGRRLWATTGPAALLGEIVASAAGINGADVGLIRLLDPARGDLAICAGVGLPDGFGDRFGRRKAGQSACDRALERRSSVVVEDVLSDPDCTDEDRELARVGGFRGFQTSPLFTQAGEPLGTIWTAFFAPHRPPTRQVRMVEQFARIASDFVENTHDHRRTAGLDQAADGLLAVNLARLGKPDGRIPA